MREGVQGFARTALAGGIPCLLASKWNIPAKESMILMTRVYAFMALNKVEQSARGMLKRRKVRCDVVCIATQDKYLTVAEALQTAVVSLLEDEEMKYNRSFFFWAAFISHGFASTKLDDALLDQIHNRVQEYQKQSNDDNNNNKSKDDENTLEMAILTLTRDAYCRLEEREETLSREWCEKWSAQASD